MSRTTRNSLQQREQRALTSAKSYVTAFINFIRICQQVIESKQQKSSAQAASFTEQHAMQNIFRLNDKGSLITLAFLMAQSAGIKDADKWREENEPALRKLHADLA